MKLKKLFKRNKNSFHKLTGIEKNILREIGIFFHMKNKEYNNETIKLLGIRNILYKKNIIYIELYRPGILIGPKGETVSKLTEYLKKTFKNDKIKISITESIFENFLYWVDWIDFE